MPNPPPQDPISWLTAAANQNHELYLAHVKAGFTTDQAMQIVLAVLTAGIHASPPTENWGPDNG